MKLSDSQSMFRTMRGTNTDSDHYLLKIIVNQKLPKIILRKIETVLGSGTNQTSRK